MGLCIYYKRGLRGRECWKLWLSIPYFRNTSLFPATLHLHIFHSWLLLLLEYITSWVHCCRPPLEPDDRHLLIDNSVSVYRNQFRNLSCNITVGFMVYKAAYRNIDRFAFLYRYIVSIPSENLMLLFSWLIMAFLSRLVPRFFLWNILAHHLRIILVYLSRFIPTFSLGTCL